jgi:hypothetical protein
MLQPFNFWTQICPEIKWFQYSDGDCTSLFLTGIWLFTFTAVAAFPLEVKATSKASIVGAIEEVMAEHEDEELDELELDEDEGPFVGPAAGPFVEEV